MHMVFVYLNVCTGEVIFSSDVLLQVQVSCQGHLLCVNLEYSPPSLLIRQWELNLAINTTYQCIKELSSMCWFAH